ncbi:TPA: hypothetical protein ACKE3D_002371 [Burkholderia dolosa]
MSYLDRSVIVPGPRAMLEREEFCRELIRTLADALKIRGGDVVPAMCQSGDFDGANKEGVRRWDSSVARAEGFIDVSSPLHGGELEGSPEYTRVHFRASLKVAVVQGDERGDGGADDGTQ